MLDTKQRTWEAQRTVNRINAKTTVRHIFEDEENILNPNKYKNNYMIQPSVIVEAPASYSEDLAKIMEVATVKSRLPRWVGRISDKESACHTGDAGSVPKSRGSPGEENGNPLQHSCQGSPMDRGSWWITIHGIAKSRTQFSY